MIADTGVMPIQGNKLLHDDAVMTSYKVSVWRDDEERLMKPDAQPHFISCCYVCPCRHHQEYHEWDTWLHDNAVNVVSVNH